MMGSAASKSLVHLDEIEKRLVKQLKHVCDNKGRETDTSKSAPILHQIGKVYHLRGKCSGDFISLIQSASLYNAAIVRSPDNQREIIEKDLKQLCKCILSKAAAEDQDADLIEQTIRVKKEFDTLRHNVNERLQLIPQLSEVIDKNQQENLQHQKVALVRNLQSYITGRYIQIMADLIEYCQVIMGKPPCSFTVIGMGSIARKEITPYSDFEHIIVLEDKIFQNKIINEIEVILSYFRWLSVIMQTVVINMKETVLPSVAIPSLNDFFHRRNKLDWFYDEFTTRGISFDFMMPRACHFPLGRQQPTKLKPWKTELIKPVTEMLVYLTKESVLKEGYHLEDILTKIGFVYGDCTIYDEFQSGIVKNLESKSNDERMESVTCQIKDDLEGFATRSTLFQMYMQREIDVKKYAYKSVTMFIAAMGRIFSIHDPSCVDIIEKLAKKNVISEYAKLNHMFAVALACEIRLRWYMVNKSQADIVKALSEGRTAVEELFNIVGKASTKSYFRIAYALQCDISKRLHLKKLHFYFNPQLLNFSISVCLMSTRFLSQSSIEATNDRLLDFDTCLNMLLKDDLLLGTSSHYHLPGDTDEDKYTKTITFVATLANAGNILYTLKCYDDALAYYQKAAYILSLAFGISFDRTPTSIEFSWPQFEELCETNIEIITLFIDLLLMTGKCLTETKSLAEAKIYLYLSANIQESISKDVTADCLLSSILHSLGVSLLGLNILDQAQMHFERSLQIQERATNNAETDTSLASTLLVLGQCLKQQKHYKEALENFKRSLQITEQAASNAETDICLAITLHDLGSCMLKLNQGKEAVKYFERSVQISARLASNVQTDKHLASALNGLGHCLLEINQCKEAVEYFERSLQISQQATLNAETDTTLAITMHELGRCLFKIGECENALNYFKQSLQIEENVATNTSIDHKFAVILNEIGCCLLKMDQPSDALPYFKRSHLILKQLSLVSKTDDHLDLALSFFNLGQCLMDMKEPKLALPHLIDCLQIEEQKSSDATADKNLGLLLQKIGQCYLELDQADKSQEYMDRAKVIQEHQQCKKV